MSSRCNGHVTLRARAHVGGDIVVAGSSRRSRVRPRRRPDASARSSRFDVNAGQADRGRAGSSWWIATTVSSHSSSGLVLVLFVPSAADVSGIRRPPRRLGASIGVRLPDADRGIPIAAVIAMGAPRRDPARTSVCCWLSASCYWLGYTVRRVRARAGGSSPRRGSPDVGVPGGVRRDPLRVLALIPFVAGLVWLGAHRLGPAAPSSSRRVRQAARPPALADAGAAGAGRGRRSHPSAGRHGMSMGASPTVTPHDPGPAARRVRTATSAGRSATRAAACPAQPCRSTTSFPRAGREPDSSPWPRATASSRPRRCRGWSKSWTARAAEGADVDPLALFACTGRGDAGTSLAHGRSGGARDVDGRCSDLVAGSPATADGHVLVAHNNDLSPRYRDELVAIEREQRSGDPKVLTIGNGIWISVGWNSRRPLARPATSCRPNDERVGIPRELQVRAMLARHVARCHGRHRAPSRSRVLVQQRARVIRRQRA